MNGLAFINMLAFHELLKHFNNPLAALTLCQIA